MMSVQVVVHPEMVPVLPRKLYCTDLLKTYLEPKLYEYLFPGKNAPAKMGSVVGHAHLDSVCVASVSVNLNYVALNFSRYALKFQSVWDAAVPPL